jgi:hypothetical protein
MRTMSWTFVAFFLGAVSCSHGGGGRDAGDAQDDDGHVEDEGDVETGDAPDAEEEEVTTVSIPEGCNLLSPAPDVECMFPFPFDQFTRMEGSTRVVDVPDALFKPHDPPITLERLSGVFDGFSPANQILYWDPAGFSREGLPPPGTTTSSDSAVQLIEWGTGRRIPVMVEPDAGAEPPFQALYIRPLLRMAGGTRYVVAMRAGLEDAAGAALEPGPVFAAFRGGAPIVSEGALDVETWRPHFEEIFGFLGEQGLERGDLLAAWDFTTGSDAFIVGEHLGAMRDAVYERQDEILATVLTDEEDPYAADESLPAEIRSLIVRKITGTLQVPPVAEGATDPVTTDFVLHVPACYDDPATTGVKVAIIGHGLFGSARDTLSQPDHMKLAESLCVVEIGINWTGMDQPSKEAIMTMLIWKQGHPVDVAFYIVDNLLQAHANFVALSILVSRPELWQGLGLDKVDAADPVYMGFSNGAIQGGTFMAMTRSVERAVLNVGGSIWTAMLERSGDWPNFEAIMQFEDKLEVKKFIALAQVAFDLVDPITFAPYLLAGDETLGIEPKLVLLQESLDDASVPNFTTEALARTAGIPPILELGRDVFGLEEGIDALAGVAGSGLARYDAQADVAPPEENLPLEGDQVTVVVDYQGDPVDAHGAVFRIPAAVEQMRRLVYEGKIYQLCSDQLCDPD